MKSVFTLMAFLLMATMLLAGCTGTESPTLNPAPAPVQNTPVTTSEPAPIPSPAPLPTPNSTSGTGIIEVYVTDPPPPEMDEIWVAIKNLDVQKAGSGWATIAEAPGEFDLKAIEGIQQYLAGQIVEAGKYTQIRLEVDNVRIVVGEDEYTAKVPSGEIKLVGNFEVLEDNTTAITLDFNGEKSVLVTGKGDYIFKPVIKLLVDHSASPGSTPAPDVTSVNPDSGNQGQTLEAVIIGTNLGGATVVSFGDNITINSYALDSDIQVTANISIAAGAITGPRDVSVTTPGGTGTLTGGFAVTEPQENSG
jgi:hypothetical protein